MDEILETIAEVGELEGFSREDMSFLPIESLARGFTDSTSSAFRMEIGRNIEFHKKRWNLTSAIRLPHLIATPEEVYAFRLEEWTPNFISTQQIVAPPIIIDEGDVPPSSIDGRIVLIRAADPGYDWILGRNIAGLVTQFGGVASHMAIRAAEFGLPAALGCGEYLYEKLKNAKLIELDCINKKVRPVS